ncbi:helix-turn-helix domain-containing protein [Burkholderia lata]|uniref:helix-turn-helix domain-containing protein n=1 Tax=Burkholderia lata (strain ATCC 17760 / DSM 23089 / LMG 22485 / NCIMB 9086 / R18194 / 383) TaxID=482957 RepID=UPI001581F5C6
MSTYKSQSLDLSDWITQAEAARLRNVTRQAIARLVANGRLRTLDIGGRLFVNRSDVLAFEPHPPGRPKTANHE